MAYVSPPPGVCFPFAGSVAPAGYLICDGSAISRTVYADLFAAIGTQYGTGDGSSTFNLPDTRGRAIYGQGTHTDVSTLGNNEGSSVGARRPKHKHSTTDPGHTHHAGAYFASGDPNSWWAAGGSGTGAGPYGPNALTTPTSGPTSGGGGSSGITVGPQTGNEPTDSGAYLVLRHIIKY